MNKLHLSLMAALLLSLPTLLRAEKSDDVKDYLVSAQQKATTWQPDAKLVYLTVGSSVQSDGSNLCKPEQPTTGWNYAFYSKTADSYYTVYACKGAVMGESSGKAFEKAPSPISEDFIGTPKVLEILRQVAHTRHLNQCQSVQALRRKTEGGPLIWTAMLDCGDVGVSVVIDAASGRILKSRRAS